jgi:hypothetical protein
MLHILRRYIATLDTCRRCRAGEVCITSASAQHTKHRDCNQQSYFHVLPLVGLWNSARTLLSPTPYQPRTHSSDGNVASELPR